MGKIIKRTVMTKLIEDIESAVMKTAPNQKKSFVNCDDLLILVEYARQLEAVILMMDEDPSKARQFFDF